jgi:tol-pal system protein YbgF
MIRRNNLPRFTPHFLALVFVCGLTGCIKTRSDLKSETGNPDSGYETKVTEVSAGRENQKVIEELRGEINRLNGRIDDLQKSNESLEQEAGKRADREVQIRDMEIKIQDLQASQAALIEAIQKKAKDREERLQKEAKEKEKEKAIPPTDPLNTYQAGRTAFRAKKYDAAIESFSQYLKFPKGKYTERALFFRGESYYAKEQYKKAILDLSSLQEKYPKSKNIARALLKIGMAFDALGMKSDAKPFYQEILDKHAKSPEAKSAKAKLK